MHASFSFHQSNLQLAYTTQAWNFNLKLVPCKQAHEMHIQMHQSSLWACSPTYVLKFYLIPFLCHFSPLMSRLSWVIHISFLEVGKKEGNTMICLGEEPTNTNLSDLRESFEELRYVYISKSNEKPQVS